MFVKGMYLSVFYCFCYDTDLTKTYSEKKVVEERVPDLDKMEDIRFNKIREDHWRVVPAPDGIFISILTC